MNMEGPRSPHEERHAAKNADAIVGAQSIDDVREAQEQRWAARLQEIDSMAGQMREKLKAGGKLSSAEDMVLGKLLDERAKVVAEQEGRTIH